MSTDSYPLLTQSNSIFFESHGHLSGIGNIQYDGNSGQWLTIHKALTKSINRERLRQLIQKHKRYFLHQNGLEFEINTVLENFINLVWGEYCFGSSVNQTEYAKFRNKLLDVLGKTFYNHSSSTSMIPYYGLVMAKLRHWWYRHELAEVNDMLSNLLSSVEYENEAEFSLFATFRRTLVENSKTLNYKVDTYVVDNAFLSPLIVDFIYNILMDEIVTIATMEIDDSCMRSLAGPEFKARGFLFPYRARIIGQSNGMMKRGDISIVNLVTSGHYFSYGARRCVGQGLFDTFKTELELMLQPFQASFLFSSFYVPNTNSRVK